MVDPLGDSSIPVFINCFSILYNNVIFCTGV